MSEKTNYAFLFDQAVGGVPSKVIDQQQVERMRMVVGNEKPGGYFASILESFAKGKISGVELLQELHLLSSF